MVTSPRWTAEKTMELISAEKTRELIAPAGNNEVHYDPFDIASLCNHCQEVDCCMNKSGKQLLTQFQKHTQANHSAINNPASLLHLAIDPQALDRKSVV